MPNYRCAPIRGRVPGLLVVLPGWGDPCAIFLGSGAVVFLKFLVRCGRVKLVSSSFTSIWAVSAELRMFTHKGEGTVATYSLTRLENPCANFLGSGAVVFLGFLGPAR